MKSNPAVPGRQKSLRPPFKVEGPDQPLRSRLRGPAGSRARHSHATEGSILSQPKHQTPWQKRERRPGSNSNQSGPRCRTRGPPEQNKASAHHTGNSSIYIYICACKHVITFIERMVHGSFMCVYTHIYVYIICLQQSSKPPGSLSKPAGLGGSPPWSAPDIVEARLAWRSPCFLPQLHVNVRLLVLIVGGVEAAAKAIQNTRSLEVNLMHAQSPVLI